MLKKILFVFLFSFVTHAQTTFNRYSEKDGITQKHIIRELKKTKKITLQDELRVFSERIDSDGVLHAKAQQFHKDIAVEGVYYSFHSKNGILIATNGETVLMPSVNTQPIISQQNALYKALNTVDAKTYIWEEPTLKNTLEKLNKNELFNEPVPYLVYLKKGENYKLCYKVEVIALVPQGRYLVYINSQTGKITEKINITNHSTGNCETNYYGTQNIDFNEITPGSYELADATRNIETYILPNNSINYASAILPTSTFIDWNDLSQKEALDVQWSSQVVYDFLFSYGIHGYDNQNTSLINYVNYGNNNASKNNAFWNGTFLTYGSGGGTVFPGPVVTLDVIAHEIGHAVTENYGNGLLYFGESGAMNESYSDIIAAAVESYVNASTSYNGLDLNEWQMSDLNGDGIRDMSNPNANNKPDTYEGFYWADTESGYDNGGVHINSGIGNFWFYLLSNGGSGENNNGYNYNVSSIGIDVAFNIALSAYDYLNYTSNYDDWREATIFVASLNYGIIITQEVINAWEAVGVGPINENFSFIARIETLEVTQYCVNTDVAFEGLVGVDGISTWSIDGIEQSSNILSFNEEGFHTVKLINTYPEGEFADDEVIIYASECSPIQSNKNTWYFGDAEGFDFSNGIAEKISYPYLTSESTIVYSDDLGNVKFYFADVDGTFNTSEVSLIDPTDNSIVADLSPINQSSAQLGAVIPNPQGNVANVIMANGIGAGTNGLYRLSIDVSEPSPTINTDLEPIDFPANFSQHGDGSIKCRESLAAIPSCNENIFWIITNSLSPSRTLVYKLDYSTNATGDLTFEQDYNFSGYPNSVIANIDVSPDGKYFCSRNKIFEFDRNSGEITFLVDLPYVNAPSRYYGFSPSGRFIYLRDFHTIKQYDLLSDDIPNSGVDIYTVFEGSTNMDFKLGADGKIYLGHRIEVVGQINPIKIIGVINNPDEKQVANKVAFNPFAYRYTSVGTSFFIFPCFIESEKANVVALDFSYAENNCFSLSFSSPSCKPYYNWDFDDGSISNEPNPTYTFTSPGEYEISLTSSVSGEVVTVTKTISVGFDASGLEILGPDEECEYDTVLIGPQNYTEYQWFLPNGGGEINNQGLQSVNITWNSLGQKEVELVVTDIEGCSALITKLVNVVNEDCDYNLSLNENEAELDFKLYPNPAINTINVISSQVFNKLVIIDINGRILKSINRYNVKCEIDVSALSNGVYFLEIQSDDSKSVKKFIKN